MLVFKDLEFRNKKEYIDTTLLKRFSFRINKAGIPGKIILRGNSIELEPKAEKKFMRLISNGINNLRSMISGRRAYYIHKNSGIPLIGVNFIGIVDRNSSLIELKTLTGCNFDCIYCSVDEGKSSRRLNDYAVEDDYVISELERIIPLKECEKIEVSLNPHGEPLLYCNAVSLCRRLAEIKEIHRISIITNGSMITKKMVDAMPPKVQFNISLDAIDKNVASKMMGVNVNTKHIMDMCRYIAKSRMEIVLAPVYMPGINDKDISGVIEFGKSIGAKIGIQNFYNYRFGRNPIKGISMEKFSLLLDELEKKHDVKLQLDAADFDIVNTKPLPKPFRRGDRVKAKIVMPGRLNNEMIAAANNRLISVINCSKKVGDQINVKLVKSKDNCFVGVS